MLLLLKRTLPPFTISQPKKGSKHFIYYLVVGAAALEIENQDRNMTEDFSLKALVLGTIRLSASTEGQKLLRL